MAEDVQRLGPGPDEPRRRDTAGGGAILDTFSHLLPGMQQKAVEAMNIAFNATMGRGHDVLTKVSAFWINILVVWLLFLVTFYLARYVALGFAFIPVWLTVFNGLTHVIASVSLGRYNPGLYTSLALFFPWGLFLLVYFAGVVTSDLLFNVFGLLAAVIGHAVIVVYALRRRSKLEGRPAS